MNSRNIRQMMVRIYRGNRILAYACGISGAVLYFLGRTPGHDPLRAWSAVLLMIMFVLFCLSYLIFAVLKAMPPARQNPPEKKVE